MYGFLMLYAIMIIIQLWILTALRSNTLPSIQYSSSIPGNALASLSFSSFHSASSNYISVEINKYIKNKNNVDLYWIIYNISSILILTTLSHIIIKIGVFNSISYNLNYWLIGTGLGLYLCPFLIYGYSLLIYVINYSVYKLYYIFHNKYNYVKTMYSGSNYNSEYMFLLMDISNPMNIYRGVNNIMNWLYQMIYYGVRLWLVFVLHSFSLGCFGELLTVITDNNLILNIYYFGLLGLGLMLFLLVVFYLSIQIYVYISFSLSFLHSTMLLLFYHPIYPSANPSSNSSLCSLHPGLRVWSSVFSRYLLIPVSLVDVLSINMILYVIVLYSSLLFVIPILLSSFNNVNTYQYVYNSYSSSSSTFSSSSSSL